MASARHRRWWCDASSHLESLEDRTLLAAGAPGDFLLSDNFLDAVISVDRETGQRDIISDASIGDGPILQFPRGLAIDSDGNLFVADSPSDSVVRIDIQTGNRFIFSSDSVGIGPGLEIPRGIAISAAGTIFVADGGSSVLGVIAINRAGNRAVVSNAAQGDGPDFVNPQGIAVLDSDSLVVVDRARQAIIRIDLADGDRTILSSSLVGSGPEFDDANGIAVDDDGTIFVANRGANAGLIQVDSVSGNRTLVTSEGPNLDGAFGVAVDRFGSVISSDRTTDSVFRVSLDDGTRIRVSGQNIGSGPQIFSPRLGLVVVPFPSQIDNPPESADSADSNDPPPIDSTIRFAATPASRGLDRANTLAISLTINRQQAFVPLNRLVADSYAQRIVDAADRLRSASSLLRTQLLLIESLVDEGKTTTTMARAGTMSELLETAFDREFEPGEYRIHFFGDSVDFEHGNDGRLSEEHRELIRDFIQRVLQDNGIGGTDRPGANPTDDAENKVKRTAGKDRETSLMDDAWQQWNEIADLLLLRAAAC